MQDLSNFFICVRSNLQIIPNTNRFREFAQCAAPKLNKAFNISWILLQLILHNLCVRPAHRNRLHERHCVSVLSGAVHMKRLRPRVCVCVCVWKRDRESRKKCDFFSIRFSITFCRLARSRSPALRVSIRFYDDVEFCLWRRECENRE